MTLCGEISSAVLRARLKLITYSSFIKVILAHVIRYDGISLSRTVPSAAHGYCKSAGKRP